MRVYRLEPDSNRVRKLLPTDPAVFETDWLVFDGRPKLSWWRAPSVYVYDRHQPERDFYSFCAGTIVLGRRAADVLRRDLEAQAELLPLHVDDQSLWALNVTAVLDCLEQQRTTWVTTRSAAPSLIEEYEFQADVLSVGSVFKIPETARGEILLVDGPDDHTGLKAAVERHGLIGLSFELLWTNE